MALTPVLMLTTTTVLFRKLKVRGSMFERSKNTILRVFPNWQLFSFLLCFGTGMSCVDGCTHSRVVYIIQYLNVHPLWAQPLHCARASLLSHPTAVTFHPAKSPCKFWYHSNFKHDHKDSSDLHVLHVYCIVKLLVFTCWWPQQSSSLRTWNVPCHAVNTLSCHLAFILHCKVSNNRRTKV